MTDENGIGDNGPPDDQDEFELTPLEQKALFFSHLNPMLRQKAVCDEARAKYNKLRKLAKAEGFKLRLMDEAVRINEAEDDEIIVQEIKDRVQMAVWLGLPVGSQLGMFEDTDHLAPLVDRARDEGTVAGALGKEPRSAYEESTEAGQAWLAGWHEGQKGNAEALKSAMIKQNAAAKAEKKAKAKAKARKSRKGEAAAAEPTDLNPVGEGDTAAADGIPAFLDKSKNKGDGAEDAAAD